MSSTVRPPALYCGCIRALETRASSVSSRSPASSEVLASTFVQSSADCKGSRIWEDINMGSSLNYSPFLSFFEAAVIYWGPKKGP